MNIVLIGFMASGKTTLGRKLAKQLDYSFIDTDSLIEQKAGKSIPAIFKEDGEDKFRELESSVLVELGSGDNQVISTGGGIVIKAVNRTNLQKMGKVVYLKVLPQDVLARITDYTTRPLINYTDPAKRLEVVQKLLELREPWYQESANIVIESDTGQIDKNITEIKQKIGIN